MMLAVHVALQGRRFWKGQSLTNGQTPTSFMASVALSTCEGRTLQ